MFIEIDRKYPVHRCSLSGVTCIEKYAFFSIMISLYHKSNDLSLYLWYKVDTKSPMTAAPYKGFKYIKTLSHFTNCLSTDMKMSISSGLEMCAFMPFFNAASLSSSSALAVMAMIGRSLTSFLGMLRIVLVAS